MEQLFLSIYHYFQRQKSVFWSVFAGILILLAVGASRIRIEEDITRFFPDDERVEKLNYVFQHSRFADRMVVMVSVNDSTVAAVPDSLISFTEELLTALQPAIKPYVSSITAQVDDAQVMELFQSVRKHLPIFLEEKDYTAIDSIIRADAARQTLRDNYRQLISPSGIITKDIITHDPLGFSFLVLKKLQQLQYDKNFELYDNYVLTRDHRHLLSFIQPKYRANETGKNLPFIETLHGIIDSVSARHTYVKASYFGAVAVAAGNAKQLQQDSLLTISLMLILLAIFLIGFFRKKRVPLLILIPVAFGALFSLCLIYFIQQHISILAIAAGSIILGIAVNYSLHFLVHLKHTQDVPTVIKDLVKPMTLGSATTVLAFLCLQFVNAEVLRDLGLFAALSLVGAALCSLIFLPHLIPKNIFVQKTARSSFFTFKPVDGNKYLVLGILIITPLFLYFAPSVSFNADISDMNYMSNDLKESQKRLENINQSTLSAVYFVSQAPTFEHALQRNERLIPQLKELQRQGLVQKYSNVSSFIISDSLQRLRLNRWNEFWNEERTKVILTIVREEGKALKFSDRIFQNFNLLIGKEYKLADATLWASFRSSFFEDFIIEESSLATVITLANVDPTRKGEVYKTIEMANVNAFDRQMLTNLFVEYVHADFNFIVSFTAMLVFFALLISYGRIELTLITFVPMLITWIWILGIMALMEIEFNIVNVMISTFIFGLGDDYSIFTMDGLQQEYTQGKKNLASIRTSILLSALTTISGLGVLIFAQHPALRSIAAISIIGIVCVFIMSQTIEPFLFRWLITNRTARGFAPMTFWGIGKTVFTYGFFVLGSFFLTVVGLLLKLIPFARKKVRLFFHELLSFFTRAILYLTPQLKIRIIGGGPETFSRASIIVSNHSSFLDILLTIMLHPRLILLTNNWVWNSPVFGGVVRLADYYPVMEGAEDSIERLKGRIEEGYSVVVFPEGTRSADGRINRFHKGAFFIADILRLPVRPLMIHGAGESIPKNTIYVNNGYVTMKFLPVIGYDQHDFGSTYQERTKSIARYFKAEHHKLSEAAESAEFFRYKLISNYLYKGPILEWYARIKLSLEKNYRPFHDLIPTRGSILDLGCGYGFLPYMLHFLSGERHITGVDYDEDKIEIANHCYSRNDSLTFIHADINRFELKPSDAIIISDVLHYLQPEDQDTVLVKSIAALNPNGRLIIREGNRDLKERHQGTRLSEFFSVKLLKFNKSVNALHFISGDKIKKLAAENGCSVRVVDDTKFTSNVIFVVQKK